MNDYLVINDPACLDYGYVFYIKAENKKEVRELLKKHYKENGYGYHSEDIKIYTMEELSKSSVGNITELI
jgi:hypothetical protein